MKLVCELCHTSTDSYNEWVDHLTNDGHQNLNSKINFENLEGLKQGNCYVVTPTKSRKKENGSSEICEFDGKEAGKLLSKFGLVSNVIILEETLIIQYEFVFNKGWEKELNDKDSLELTYLQNVEQIDIQSVRNLLGCSRKGVLVNGVSDSTTCGDNCIPACNNESKPFESEDEKTQNNSQELASTENTGENPPESQLADQNTVPIESVPVSESLAPGQFNHKISHAGTEKCGTSQTASTPPLHKGIKGHLYVTPTKARNYRNFSIVFKDGPIAASEKATYDRNLTSYSKFTLNQQMEVFTICTSLSDEDIQRRQAIIDKLQSIITTENARFRVPPLGNSVVKLRPFGSFKTGLSKPSSDVDIFVDCGQKGGDHEGSVRLLEICCKWLRKAEDPRTKNRLFSSITKITRTRIPILRFVDAESNIQGDLSFDNDLSVQNSELVKAYIETDCRIKMLMSVLRFWGDRRSIIGSNSIKSYALVLIILVFLMRRKIIPSVYYLQENLSPTESNIINGWEAGFCRKRIYANIEPDVSVTQLVRDFLRDYRHVELDDIVISPYVGDFILKDDFESCDWNGLPEEALQHYIDSPNNFHLNSPICVQDPFDLTFNVTQSAPEDVVARFQSGCTVQEQVLSRLNSKSNNLLSFFERYFND